MKTSSIIISVSLLFLCALHAQQKPTAGSVIRREGKPDCVQVTDDNKAMAQAVQKARKTMDKFIAAARSPKTSQSRFAVKKPFIEGDKVEHLWVNEAASMAGSFTARSITNQWTSRACGSDRKSRFHRAKFPTGCMCRMAD